MGTVYTYEKLRQHAVEYPEYVIVPIGYWKQTTTSGVKNDKRIYFSARKREKRAR